MPAKGQRKVTKIEFTPIPRKVVSYEYPASKLERLVAPMLLVGTIIGSLYASTLQPEELINPYVGGEVQVVQAHTTTPQPTPEPTPFTDEQSLIIAEAVEDFLPNHRSEALMIMHCLAHRENGHHANPDGHGDNGKAGGPFQFWNETWTRMRTRMIADGHATEIGSRYDFRQAARTTAYAISKGWGREWGPIYRASKGSNFATCQVPSWY